MSNEATVSVTEYKQLLSAWDSINHSKRPDLLTQMFSSYLDHIWTESQTMLHCAQYWQTSQTDMLDFSDAVHAMNSLGLHLMKQSLQTRQNLAELVEQTGSDDNDTFYSASPHSQHEKLFGTFDRSSSASIRAMDMEQPLNRTNSFLQLLKPLSASNENRYSYQDTLTDFQSSDCISENIKYKGYDSFENFQGIIDNIPSDNGSDMFDSRSMMKKPNLYSQITFSKDENHNESTTSCQNMLDISAPSLVFSNKHGMTVEESTPPLGESAYITDTFLIEKPEKNMKKSASSTFKSISSTFLKPWWNVKLAMKKRSQKVDIGDDLPKQQPKKFASKKK